MYVIFSPGIISFFWKYILHIVNSAMSSSQPESRFSQIRRKRNVLWTRMYSSRMRTARSLTVCRGCLPGGGSPCPGGASLPGGSPCPGGVSLLGRGVSLLGGLPARGVSLLGAVSLPGGSPCLGGFSLPETPPPWTEFLTHAYENITLPQTTFAGGKNNHCTMESTTRK